MLVSDVLDICSQFDAELITGKEGLPRRVHTIEVMEVPEVESWARKGLLIITTFYAVRNNQEDQLNIIRTLIEKKAAGIIVKIGRFIDKLPKDVVLLAKKERFPIILLPKKVPYIKILTPLYMRLHEGQKINNENSAWQQFENKSFSTLDHALNELAHLMNSSVYIEDIEGRLLYISKPFVRDGWRNSISLFSVPADKSFRKRLVHWQEYFRNEPFHFLFSQIPGQKNRIIMPLFARGKLIAFVHLVANQRDRINEIDETYAEKIINKIYVTMMGEFIDLQQQRLIEKELLNTRIKEQSENNRYVILYFQREPHQSSPTLHSSFIDYHCLFRKKINDLIQHIDGVSDYFLFDKNSNLYALLTFSNKRINSTLMLKQILNDRLLQSTISDTSIAISSVFYKGIDIENKIKAVTKIIDIGKEVYPEEQVYSYNKLGIYEFFLPLSGNGEVKQYINGILGPLYEDPVLFQTLNVYLQQNGNASQAAEQLFVNRRTITNRLQKIKELLGTDLDDAENIFILQFCFRMKKFE